jgi:hypothetical protein
MKDENELDQFFRKGLSEPDIPFNELDWEKMEKRLAPAKSKRAVLLWPMAAAGIAASVLLLMFLIFKEDATSPVESKLVSHTKIVVPSKEPMKDGSKKTLTHTVESNISVQKDISQSVSISEALVQLSTPQASNSIVRTKTDAAQSTDSTHISTSPQIAPTSSVVTTKPAENIKSVGRLSFSVIAAPDISSSPANLGTKVSTNLGLLATYSLTKKLSLSTGVIYARKLYDYGGASVSAYEGSGKAMETFADCRVLDIPLNLNYSVYSKGQNSISLNTGLSSYLMLNEKYKYISNDDLGNTKTSVIKINNENQHLFGVANLGVSFNRKINSQLSIGVQPFIKIPLTGIGYHDTRLRSTGVAFSLDLNMRRK